MAAFQAASWCAVVGRNNRHLHQQQQRTWVVPNAHHVAAAAPFAASGTPARFVASSSQSLSWERLRAATIATRRASLWTTVDGIIASNRRQRRSDVVTAAAAPNKEDGPSSSSEAVSGGAEEEPDADKAAPPAADPVAPTPTENEDAAAAAAAADDDDEESDPDSGSPAMFDRLANIFLNRDEENWIGLLASSDRWPTLRSGFFVRLKERASTEDDPEEMLRLSRLLRLLQGTSDRVALYAELLAEVQGTDEDLWEGMVTNRRAEFTTEFFQFLRYKLEAMVRAQAQQAADGGRGAAAVSDGDGINDDDEDEEGASSSSSSSSSPGGVVDGEVEHEGDAADSLDANEREARKRRRQATSAAEDASDKERDDLARLASRLISICEAFDEATKDQGVLEEAAENFKELLEVETLEEMNTKIDQLAAEQKLDPALVLTAAKAYMSVKESPYVEEEVKDVMAHLYFKMKETMGRQQPKEVRILKFLLAMDNPQEIRSGLEDAFTPGPELTTQDEDYLSCEAPALLATIEAVLKAYDQQKGKANITGQAAELMQPEVIEKMKTIKFQIEGNFL